MPDIGTILVVLVFLALLGIAFAVVVSKKANKAVGAQLDKAGDELRSIGKRK